MCLSHFRRRGYFFMPFAITCFAIAMYFLYSTIVQGDVLRSFWADYWI